MLRYEVVVATFREWPLCSARNSHSTNRPYILHSHLALLIGSEFSRLARIIANILTYLFQFVCVANDMFIVIVRPGKRCGRACHVSAKIVRSSGISKRGSCSLARMVTKYVPVQA